MQGTAPPAHLHVAWQLFIILRLLLRPPSCHVPVQAHCRNGVEYILLGFCFKGTPVLQAGLPAVPILLALRVRTLERLWPQLRIFIILRNRPGVAGLETLVSAQPPCWRRRRVRHGVACVAGSKEGKHVINAT